MKDNFPHVSQELLKALSELYPKNSPQQGESHVDLMFRGGQRQVIDFLTHKHESQQILNPN